MMNIFVINIQRNHKCNFVCAFINTQKNCVHQPNLTCKILQTLQKNHYQKNNSQGLNTNT